MFLTRIPCPSWIDHSEERLNRSVAYFPLVGVIVGGICAMVFLVANRLFSREISVVLCIIAGVLVTGAFHEDGFADFCDGFGGGWTKEKILEIMKDSRIGAFGTIALILLFLLKYHVMIDLNSARLPALLIAGHSISRMFPVWIMKFLPYVRDVSAVTKPIGVLTHSLDMVAATLFGLVPLAYFGRLYMLIPAVASAVTALLMALYMRKWIGGYTGDCLGAVQQVSEVVFYGATLAIWTFM